MSNLPETTLDHKNSKQLVEMLGVLKSNTLEVIDPSYQQMKDLDQKIQLLTKVRTKSLGNPTGIGDASGDFERGFLWDSIKENAMLDPSIDDQIIVSPFSSNSIEIGGTF